LPDLKQFEAFRTTGPDGTSTGDINGRAAAIECYLDLGWNTEEAPAVRWTSYEETLSRYQGKLINKVSYTKAFLSLRKVEAGYNFGGLEAVLDSVISECIEIAEMRSTLESASS
jgi:hypothetical protein